MPEGQNKYAVYNDKSQGTVGSNSCLCFFMCERRELSRAKDLLQRLHRTEKLWLVGMWWRIQTEDEKCIRQIPNTHPFLVVPPIGSGGPPFFLFPAKRRSSGVFAQVADRELNSHSLRLLYSLVTNLGGMRTVTSVLSRKMPSCRLIHEIYRGVFLS